MHRDAAYWIDTLNLQSHPEGGYYHEAFAGSDMLQHTGLPNRYSGARKAYTSIYFLLESHQVSHLHRLKSDEIWNFYTGSPLTIHVIHPDGRYESLKLGLNFENGESYQHCVPAGCWFGSTVDEPNGYSLVGCFVAPGFEFEDFELAERGALSREYPEYEDMICRLTSI